MSVFGGGSGGDGGGWGGYYTSFVMIFASSISKMTPYQIFKLIAKKKVSYYDTYLSFIVGP